MHDGGGGVGGNGGGGGDDGCGAYHAHAHFSCFFVFWCFGTHAVLGCFKQAQLQNTNTHVQAHEHTFASAYEHAFASILAHRCSLRTHKTCQHAELQRTGMQLVTNLKMKGRPRLASAIIHAHTSTDARE